MVEILIPLTLSWFNHLTTPTHSSLSSNKSLPSNPLEEQTQLSGVSPAKATSFNGSLQSVQGTLQEAIASIKATGKLNPHHEYYLVLFRQFTSLYQCC